MEERKGTSESESEGEERKWILRCIHVPIKREESDSEYQKEKRERKTRESRKRGLGVRGRERTESGRHFVSVAGAMASAAAPKTTPRSCCCSSGRFMAEARKVFEKTRPLRRS